MRLGIHADAFSIARRTYGDAAPAGTPAWDHSCWVVWRPSPSSSTSAWVLAPECQVDCKMLPYSRGNSARQALHTAWSDYVACATDAIRRGDTFYHPRGTRFHPKATTDRSAFRKCQDKWGNVEAAYSRVGPYSEGGREFVRPDLDALTLTSGLIIRGCQNKNQIAEPYVEARPNAPFPGGKRWQVNTSVLNSWKSSSPTERSKIYDGMTESARRRAAFAAFQIISASEQKTLNDLTKEYVPDFTSASTLIDSMATVNGPAGSNARSLLINFVIGNLENRKAVIRSLASSERVARGQNPVPQSRQQGGGTGDEGGEGAGGEEEAPSAISPWAILAGVAVTTAIVGGAIALLRGEE